MPSDDADRPAAIGIIPKAAAPGQCMQKAKLCAKSLFMLQYSITVSYCCVLVVRPLIFLRLTQPDRQ